MTTVDMLTLAGFETHELRRLANSHIGDPVLQHAVDAELLRRERDEELAAFRQAMAHATVDELHAAEDCWCCLPGPFAEAHRAILREYDSDHATGGAA
jgi:hypothetical protein